MDDFTAISIEIERALTDPDNPGTLLGLLKKRSRLIKQKTSGNEDLIRELIEQNQKWMQQTRSIMDQIQSKIEKEQNQKLRRQHLASAYHGINPAYRIFTHKS